MKRKCHNGPTNTFLIETPVGQLELISCPRGIHSLSQPAIVSDGQFNPDLSLKVRIQSQLYQDNGYTYRPALQCLEWLELYFSKDPGILSRPRPDICFLSKKEESFTEKVWDTLAENVKFGQKVSYGELAEMCGNGRACQAVGQAMRNNPVMIIVPCHRVILSNGRTGNYSGGKKNSMKVWLLRHEGAIP